MASRAGEKWQTVLKGSFLNYKNASLFGVFPEGCVLDYSWVM